jgi:XTP/dITP diphosphohydrolase
MKLLLATTNKDKLREYRQLLKGSDFRIYQLPQKLKGLDVKENGKTFVANAVIKARVYGEKSGTLTLCDDTGLEIKALGGFPGLKSHRFAAEGFPRARKELLRRLKGTPPEKRQARFVCVIALYLPESGKIITFTGVVNGFITGKESGGRGFGYDPIFFVPEAGKTFAQMSLEQKNSLSHRGRAAAKLKAWYNQKRI